MAAETPVRATEENWAYPPTEGRTFNQVKGLDLPFGWELVDGMIAVRGRTKLWHDTVLNKIERAWEQARPAPYAVVTEACVMFDQDNIRVPDVMVYDRTGLDFSETECVPAAQVQLARRGRLPRLPEGGPLLQASPVRAGQGAVLLAGRAGA